MTPVSDHLPEIWFFIIGFLLLYYAVTDGYDLGVGILSLVARDDRERGLMMTSIQGTWHDNQTWLVLLGGMLFGAFPVFYGILFSALYIPILVMLIGLIFRGIAFEFRASSRNKKIWGYSFGIGSLVTASAQGFAVGGLFGGLEVVNTRFIGSIWGWLSPYSFLASIGIIAGYLMLGGSYLILKTQGEMQERAFRCARIASYFTIVISVAVYIEMPFRYPFVWEKWLAHPIWFSIAPAIAAASFVLYQLALRKHRELSPLMFNIVFVVSGFIGISAGIYPYILPNVLSPSLSIHATAASPYTLSFMLIAMSVILPIILTYSGYKLWVFRGKTKPEEY